MINRDMYINQLLEYKDTEYVKVIIGMRKSGKATILKLFMEKLLEIDKGNNVIYMNFESFEFEDIEEYKQMYKEIKNKIKENTKNYILLDEVQRIDKWEKCVNALLVDVECDIYITGSNAYLLSSELATYLSGRYVELKVFPLSFKEYITFVDFNNNISIEEKFNSYMKYGGMPGAVNLLDKQEVYENVIKGIYNTVFMKDVIVRNKLTDVVLLEKILKFLMSNIGSIVSAKKIADFLTSQGTKVTHNTITNYIKMLENAYIIYNVQRYDIKGKEILKTLGKYYLADLGMRNVNIGLSNLDIGHLLENIVYFELLRRGYDVYIGKTDNLEVDFIATNTTDKKYYQVSLSILDKNVETREMKPLLKIKDSFDKTIITMDKLPISVTSEGIKLKNIIDFLLEE